jgi:hypothetical protein
MPRYQVEFKFGQSIVDAIDEEDAEDFMASEYGRVNGPYEAERIEVETESFGFGSMFIHTTEEYLSRESEENE